VHGLNSLQTLNNPPAKTRKALNRAWTKQNGDPVKQSRPELTKTKRVRH